MAVYKRDADKRIASRSYCFYSTFRKGGAKVFIRASLWDWLIFC